MAKPRAYARLTRSTASVATYKSLWLGDDHLLIVNSTGYTEGYRRILLQDIQGFFTIDSSRRSSWALVWIALAVASALIAGVSLVTGGRPTAATIFLVLGVIGALWNYLLGPSCRVFVLTGVQTLQLPSLVRKRKARKVLARLRPLIAAAQQDLATAAATPPRPEPPAVVEPPPLV